MKQDLIRKANASNNLRVVKKNKTKDKVRKMNIDTSANKTMHWISAFNIAVDELRDEVYEKCSKVYSANEAMFSEIYEKVTEAYNVTTIESIEDLRSPEFNELMVNILKSHQEEIIECVNEAYEFSQKAPFMILDRCLSMSRPRRKDILMLQKRTSLTHKAIVSQIEYFLRETVQNFSNNMEDYIDSLIDSVEFMENLNEENNDLNDNIDLSEEACKKHKIQKIYNYEDMGRLAISNGYEYKRSNGSHDVYEHTKTNKIIVIPAHSLGLGLSIKIQKQIFNNAC